ncbi:MAG TPA: helix-turn-helix domain-containing protein [Methylocella sp.]|nr:helix-turn-helix domain-containing protein [Methylocella sp.]
MSTYRYTESGLDNVIIDGVDFLADDAGDGCVMIPNVNGLHKTIARGIVIRKASMSGPELRFIRTEMGMTQAELAQMLHREPLAVSRWERGETPIDANAEALVRLYAIQELKLLDQADVRAVAGWCVPTAETPPIRIDGSDPSNYRLAA